MKQRPLKGILVPRAGSVHTLKLNVHHLTVSAGKRMLPTWVTTLFRELITNNPVLKRVSTHVLTILNALTGLGFHRKNIQTREVSNTDAI